MLVYRVNIFKVRVSEVFAATLIEDFAGREQTGVDIDI
jgi:hypothetical protein